MTSVRRLEIRVDQTGSASKGIAGIAGSVGSIAGVGLAAGVAAATGVAALTVGVVKLGASLVGLGSDAEEMESKFKVVFGDSAPEATRELDAFGDAVGRNKFVLMEMASTVQDTFVPLGFARDTAKDMSVGLTQLAVDMGSFNNVADEQVMLDLQSAIVGNHETMRKYGVIITQATLDQELLNMGVEGGVKSATEQEKVLARLNIIYAGTTDAQGDATETAGSWANQMRSLKSTVSEAATSMGTELLPVVAPLLKDFTTWVKDIMPGAIEVFGQFAEDLGATVGPAMALIQDAITRIAEAFGINTGEVSTADVVLLAFEKTLGLVVTTLQLVALTFQGVAVGVESAKAGVEGLKRAWNDMKRAAQDAVAAIPDWMIPGSPTPFEMGLRGIEDAAKNIDLGMGIPARAGTTMAGAGGSAGGNIFLNLTYAPVVSLADEYEAQEKLTPFILEALRKAGVSI